MSRDTNDELREDHREQDEHRQDRRDAVFERTGDAPAEGSQDERRHEGDERA